MTATTNDLRRFLEKGMEDEKFRILDENGEILMDNCSLISEEDTCFIFEDEDGEQDEVGKIMIIDEEIKVERILD